MNTFNGQSFRWQLNRFDARTLLCKHIFFLLILKKSNNFIYSSRANVRYLYFIFSIRSKVFLIVFILPINIALSIFIECSVHRFGYMLKIQTETKQRENTTFNHFAWFILRRQQHRRKLNCMKFIKQNYVLIYTHTHIGRIGKVKTNKFERNTLGALNISKYVPYHRYSSVFMTFRWGKKSHRMFDTNSNQMLTTPRFFCGNLNLFVKYLTCQQ